MLIDPYTGIPQAGFWYDMSAEEIIEYCKPNLTPEIHYRECSATRGTPVIEEQKALSVIQSDVSFQSITIRHLKAAGFVEQTKLMRLQDHQYWSTDGLVVWRKGDWAGALHFLFDDDGAGLPCAAECNFGITEPPRGESVVESLRAVAEEYLLEVVDASDEEGRDQIRYAVVE